MGIDNVMDVPYYVQYAASAEVSKFQVAGVGVRALPDAVIDGYVSAANANLGACGDVASFLASGMAWKENLAAAYLNEAADRGIFEPFDVLQPIWVEYARFVFCDQAALETSDEGRAALGLLDDVNDAQRSFDFPSP